ncbi:hypothetical protein ACFLUZ_01525 [Chloroflexota bacterium]
MKSPLILIISAVVAVLLILAGIDYFILNPPSKEPPPAEVPAPPRETKPPTVPPTPVIESKTPTEPPAPAVASETPATPPPLSLEQNMEKLGNAIADVSATGENQEVTLVLTEAEANEKAADLLTKAELPEDLPLEIKNVHIDFQTGNNLITEIEAVVYGFTGKITVKSHVSIEDGKPAVEVTDVGVPPLPGVKDMVSDLISQKIGALLDQLTGLGGNEGVTVEYQDIDIQEGEATITLLVKPRA